MDEVRQAARSLCYEYIESVGLLSPPPSFYALPTLRYMLKLYTAVPLKYVIVSERPYKTDIVDEVFSALSYDTSKSRPTPSTLGVSYDVATVTGMNQEEVEQWFSKSWRYLSAGIAVVNVMCFGDSSSPNGCEDKIAFQRLLRNLILLSYHVSSEKIHIICMGKQALYNVMTTVSTLGSKREAVARHRYKNPAIVAHSPGCDMLSLGFTLEHPSASKAISNCIRRSKLYRPLTKADFPMTMSSIEEEVRASQAAIQTTADSLAKLFDTLKVKTFEPELKSALSAFVLAVTKHTEIIIKHSTSMAISDYDVKNRAGKQSEWGNREPFVKPPRSNAVSSQVSGPSNATVHQTLDVVEKKLADESDPDESQVVQQKATETPPAQTRTVKRRVVKRRAVVPQSVAETPVTPAPAPADSPSSSAKLETPQAHSPKRRSRVVNLTPDMVSSLSSLEYAATEGTFELTEEQTASLSKAVRDKNTTSAWVSSVSTAIMQDEIAGLDINAVLGLTEGDVSNSKLRELLRN